MMLQYKKIKEKFRDAILFFRLGDFYEMFEEDAREASKLLDLTLTKRNGVPMCGIPYHASKNYIAKLMKAGKKVAICEQTFIPKPGRGIARREVTEVITPGTVIDEDLLERDSNNYLVALGKYKERYSVAYIDLSTADFGATSFGEEEKMDYLKREMARFSPREIIVQESMVEEDEEVGKLLAASQDMLINRYPEWSFDITLCRERIEKQLGVANLKGYGLKEDSAEIVAAGIILDYIAENSKSLLPHIHDLKVYRRERYVGLDESSQKNLELVKNMNDGSRKYTLLEVLDFTKTAMGSRKLKKWLLNPLRNRAEIEERLKRVEYFYKNQLVLSSLRDTLGHVMDLERLASKIAMDKATPKDLLGIKITLKAIMNLPSLLESDEMKSYLEMLARRQSEIAEIVDLLEATIVEDPPVLLTEGNIIKSGYHGELDRLRDIRENSREILGKYLEEEKEKTGIANLKVRYNRVIGYFLEVTKSNLGNVPPYFIRRQSLVNGERFTTERLISLEAEINSASEKIVEIEKKIFLEIRGKVKAIIGQIFDVADTVSTLDVLQGFAFASTIRGYSKPEISSENEIIIRGGRHPVVEAYLPGGGFIPNDTELSVKEKYFLMLTGPNMAGKSTYLRQVALIVLMAHIGCFVPAEMARIGIVDSIFCRVGATDNLARGESTFLIEMTETANIVRNATAKSLIIMDEVGRGTSTRDGQAIARAIVEYMLEEVRGITLFATHYHELTSIEHRGLVNKSMDVLEQGRDIVFLKKIKDGPADHSYGIHVARLAGLPEVITERAYRLLEESLSLEHDGSKRRKGISKSERSFRQKSLFAAEDTIKDRIRNIRIDTTTPLQALNILNELQEELKSED